MNIAKQILTLTSSEQDLRRLQESRFRAGFWISPHGKAIPVDKDHIRTVITRPEVFGLTLEEIQRIYDEEGESLYTEGDAREKIIVSLVTKGWIRVRNYSGKRSGDFWSLNVARISDRIKERITDFFQDLFPNGGYDDVVIDSLAGQKRMSVNDIVRFKLFQEGITKKDRSKTIQFFPSVHDLPLE